MEDILAGAAEITRTGLAVKGLVSFLEGKERSSDMAFGIEASSQTNLRGFQADYGFNEVVFDKIIMFYHLLENAYRDDLLTLRVETSYGGVFVSFYFSSDILLVAFQTLPMTTIVF